jgi:hypothetical protein
MSALQIFPATYGFQVSSSHATPSQETDYAGVSEAAGFQTLRSVTCVVSLLLSLGIWSVGEGFGGPYKLGESTDVGTALVYALLSGVLLAIAAGRYYSVDQWLTRRLGRFGFLAAGVPWHRRQRPVLK